MCPICKEIGSIYRKKDKIRIPQKSQIHDFNSLLDFCSVTWFLRYKQGLEMLKSYSNNIPSHQPIFDNPTRYVKHIPFSIHSETEIAKFEEEIYSKIRKDRDEISGTNLNRDISTEFTQEDILKGMIISACSYISFTSLKRFNQYLEPIPITILDKDLKDIVHEFYKSVQYTSLDSRRVYSSLEQAKYVIMNSNDNDFYYKLHPVYEDKKARCTDCKRKITVDEHAGDDLRRYRCPHCYHKGGPISAGRLTRIKPSTRYQRKVISKQLKTLNRFSQGADNVFIFIRNTYISGDETTKEKYRLTFDECFSDFLNGIGPPDFRLAVRHYVPTKRNNTPCYVKTEDDLMNIRIVDFEYLNALSQIYLAKSEGREIQQEFISIAERKLISLKFPLTLISTKITTDLTLIGAVLSNGIQKTIDELEKLASSRLPSDNKLNTLISEIQDRGSNRDKLLFIMVYISYLN